MLKRHKSRRSRATDLLTKYLKLKAAAKVAKTAVRHAPKKGLLLAGGIGTAAIAAHKLRSGRPTAA